MIIYTDGGSRNHGNIKGGHVHKNDKSAYAYWITENQKTKHVGTKGYYGKTNNQMEVLAVIRALAYVTKRNLAKHYITVVSDSKYVDNAINLDWLKNWYRKGFKKGHHKRKNYQLWEQLYSLLQSCPNIKFRWTKGHASGKTSDSRGNIFVDHTLNKTMDKMH